VHPFWLRWFLVELAAESRVDSLVLQEKPAVLILVLGSVCEAAAAPTEEVLRGAIEDGAAAAALCARAEKPWAGAAVMAERSHEVHGVAQLLTSTRVGQDDRGVAELDEDALLPGALDARQGDKRPSKVVEAPGPIAVAPFAGWHHQIILTPRLSCA
jgi:hypothetical protein